MTRPGRWAIFTAATLAAVALSPPVLRHVPFFTVRQVEVVGARYVAPQLLVDTMGLAPDQNLFDRLDDAEARVKGVPGIVRARVTRHLPGTLRVTVVEREPVGLVSTENGMVPLDCIGQRLPYDPARSGLALPIVERGDSVLVGALCVVRASDSALFDAVQMVRYATGGSVMLELQDQRVRLRAAPTTAEVKAVGAVRAYLAGMGSRFTELDARFQGLVYARGRRS